jgi:lipoprotein-anchoring transpeptidase ErfK/SrfK
MWRSFPKRLGQWTLVLCVTAASGLTVQHATAQTCDDRYPYTCREYRPQEFPMPLSPFYPARPRDIAPAEPAPRSAPVQPGLAAPSIDPALRSQYAALYASVRGEPYPIPAVRLSEINPEFLRRSVSFPTSEAPGTIIIDARNHFLYFVEGSGRAVRYGVGVGRQGFGWSGIATIHDKQEWPDWYPPKEMIARQPELRRHVTQLQSGLGVPGGPGNPLGARAMYLWQGNKDTLYRIHGTVEPWTIGTNVSSGCIRMINQDAIDLYARVAPGARVVVLPSRS